jgi:hypothetical protein
MEKKRNLWVIPTEKPSRLYKTGNFLLLDSKAMPNNTLETINQNINITSEKEIKEGDYFLTPNNRIFKCYKAKNATIYYVSNSGTLNIDPEYCRKIILTTDQDLIKDGVQAIDDEFLEWFVKNSSCEEVEVISLRKSSGHYDEKEIWHWDFLAYKILIPQEEPKYSEDEFEMQSRIINKVWDEEPKQETENLENFKKLVSNETSPALKDFAKTFKNHCLECNKNIENCSCIDNWLEKHGDPEIAKQVEKEAKELHEKATLEEFAKEFLIKELKMSKTQINTLYSGYVDAVVKFHKIQAERMYSEEDMIQFSSIVHLAMIDSTNNKSFEELFEQFKKK